MNKYIIGCDEVGRGPIAGPVVGCALRLKLNKKSKMYLKELGVTDSKKISLKKRKLILCVLGIDTLKLKPNQLYKVELENISFSFSVASISEKQIDKINILNASLLAMKKAALKLSPLDEDIIIDGNKVFDIKDYRGKINYLIKGDTKSFAIGLASIIAKDFRDEKMRSFDLKYPGYGFSKHAGYPTKAHKEAVKNLGVSKIHRRSFRGVKEYCSRKLC